MSAVNIQAVVKSLGANDAQERNGVVRKQGQSSWPKDRPTGIVYGETKDLARRQESVKKTAQRRI